MRRVAWVLGIYLVVGWVVWLGADWLRTVLALPPLFRGLLLVLLALGLPLAVVLAWRYPDLGSGKEGGGGTSRRAGP